MSEGTWRIIRNILLIIIVAVVSSVATLAALLFYVVKANSYNIQACVISSFLSGEVDNDLTEAGTPNTATEKKSEYDHPLLSDTQEAMLEKAGVNVESLPSSISPEMEKCFRDNLGDEKVQEIINRCHPWTFGFIAS